MRDFGGWKFEPIGRLEVKRDGRNVLLEFFPQARYQNRDGLPLHSYGIGPFCKIRVQPTQPPGLPGVYILAMAREVLYVGECADLKSRSGVNGYGGISPRNCFDRVQPTNCRINNLVLTAAKAE